MYLTRIYESNYIIAPLPLPFVISSNLTNCNTSQFLLPCQSTVTQFGWQDLFFIDECKFGVLFHIVHECIFTGLYSKRHYIHMKGFRSLKKNTVLVTFLVPLQKRLQQLVTRRLRSRWSRTIRFSWAQNVAECGPQVLSLPSIYDGVQR